MRRREPEETLAELERALAFAARSFAHAPGGLWLAGLAALAALDRAGLRSPEALALRRRAEQMRREGEERASSHELAGLEAWIALARRRAALEEAFLAASHEAPERVSSRAELAERLLDVERRLEALDRTLAEPFPDGLDALVARLRSAHPDYEPAEAAAPPEGAPLRPLLEESARRGRVERAPSAWALLGGGFLAWFFAITAIAVVAAGVARSAIVLALLALAATALVAALARRVAERRRRQRVLDAWFARERSAREREALEAARSRWALAARALGALDAFRRTDEGASLEAREGQLPSLTPWIRMAVGGLREEQVEAFA